MKLSRRWTEIGLWALGKRWRFQVTGRSMLPTLNPGEDVLVVPVSRATKISPNDIVVCFHPTQRDLRLIKRVSETFYDGSCYVVSDNISEGTDSRSFGVVARSLVIGRVTSRLF